MFYKVEEKGESIHAELNRIERRIWCIRNEEKQLWKFIEIYELKNQLDSSIIVAEKRSRGWYLSHIVKFLPYGFLCVHTPIPNLAFLAGFSFNWIPHLPFLVGLCKHFIPHLAKENILFCIIKYQIYCTRIITVTTTWLMSWVCQSVSGTLGRLISVALACTSLFSKLRT